MARNSEFDAKDQINARCRANRLFRRWLAVLCLQTDFRGQFCDHAVSISSKADKPLIGECLAVTFSYALNLPSGGEMPRRRAGRRPAAVISAAVRPKSCALSSSISSGDTAKEVRWKLRKPSAAGSKAPRSYPHRFALATASPRPAANGTDAPACHFNTDTTGQHNHIGQAGIVFRGNGLQYSKHFFKLGGFIGRPVFLRGKANTCAIGTAPHIRAAIGGGRSPSGFDHFLNGETAILNRRRLTAFDVIAIIIRPAQDLAKSALHPALPGRDSAFSGPYRGAAI